MAAAFADDAGEIGLRIAEFAAELFVAHRFFERIEIGALNVLDHGNFKRRLLVGFYEDDRHVMHAGALRRPPASLAGDDLVSVGDAGDRAYQDRLQDAALFNRGSEVVEFALVEILARIARVRPQKLDRDETLAAQPIDRGSFSPGAAAPPR